ncbi:hypothetical protein KAR91_32060, partial [Candidatus Pacearchaeota archaeon]|nr:hypothetical protein [Candidatus Pacearchaeota archaeon]
MVYCICKYVKFPRWAFYCCFRDFLLLYAWFCRHNLMAQMVKDAQIIDAGRLLEVVILVLMATGAV